jgi:hypothetical protein
MGVSGHGIAALPKLFHIHRLAKHWLDELFGRERHSAGQLLEPGGHVGSTARERQHHALDELGGKLSVPRPPRECARLTGKFLGRLGSA